MQEVIIFILHKEKHVHQFNVLDYKPIKFQLIQKMISTKKDK